MEFSDYNGQVLEWIQDVQAKRGMDAQGTLESCQKLRQYAQQQKDIWLLGFSCYYSGETFYVLNDTERLFRYMTRALDCLIRSSQWELVARAYNILAITSINRGNAPFAMDYYLNGLSYCEKYGLQEVGSIINMNIATLYLSVGDDRQAQRYLEDSERMLARIPDCPNYYIYRTAIYINMGKCALRQNRLDQAKKYDEKIQRECVCYMEHTDQLCLLLFETDLYHALGETAARDACIIHISQGIVESFAVMDLFDEFNAYSELLLEIGRYREFLEMIALLEEPVQRARIVNLQRKLVALRIRYYKMTGQQQEYLRETGTYYELSEIMEEENSYMISAMLNVRQSLDDETRIRKEMEKKNSRLLEQAQTDALTGLGNRGGFDSQSVRMFEQAQQKKSAFAIEILDIDSFKQYNDNYGHQAGDECLVRVAQCIRHLEHHRGVSAYRYGGDEFVIIYENYTREQIECFMRKLKDDIAKLQLKHAWSEVCRYVTISQGAWVGIPQSGESAGDYLHAADEVLYGVKKRSRDGFAAGMEDEAEPE